MAGFMKSLRGDANFRLRLNKQVKRLGELERLGKGLGSDEEMQNTLFAILRMCDFNAGFLTPYFYPKFSDAGKPLSLLDRPHAMALFDLNIGGETSVRSGRQIGKEQPYSAMVLTPKGWTTMGELEVGDRVVGRDGRPAAVLEIVEQGISDVYKLTFTDGSTAECGLDHSWVVKRNKPNWKVETLRQIVDRSGMTPSSDRAIRIPLVQPVQMPAKRHKMSPYVLGLLLGDGSLSSTIPKFTTGDEELLRYIEEEQPDVRLRKISDNDYDLGATKKWELSEVTKEIRRLGLRNTLSDTKFIPWEYLHDSANNRLQLLRGLMDTDGTIYGKCQMEFYSVSLALAEGVQELVQSLGGTAGIKPKKAWYRHKDGHKVHCKLCYRVKVRLQDVNPFRLKRKADLFYKIRYERTRILKSVELVRKENSRCLVVDSPDHTYVTNNYVVTHNSSTFIARQRIYATLFKNWQSMYLTPHTDYLNQYADRFRSMEKLFRFPVQDKDKNKQNKFYKEFPNGNTIEMFRVFESADPVRGHTANEVLIDESQHFDPDFMAVVKQCLRAKKLRARYYAGTSLTTDTFLEAKYQAGSRSTWHVPTTDNTGKKTWVNLGSPEEIISCIKQDGLTCPYTGKLLDVASGEFVDEDQSAREAGLISYHVPQIVVPEYVNSASEWAVIWEDFNELPLPKFMQEVMGIPSEDGYREITSQDLENICVLPETSQARATRAMSGYYQWVISGCDWGGSDYNANEGTKASYTAQAILGVTPDRNLDILHLQTWAGMHYRQIAKEISENHKRFRGNILVSDDGAGDLYNNYLQESGYILPEKHLVLKYTAPNTKLFAKLETTGTKFMNRYGLNRTESISALFEAIKRQPAPRIRCYAWGEARRHLLDFLNVYRNIVETEQGGQKFRYRKHGSKPDDVMHAINFAYVGSKVVMNEPLIDDRVTRDKLRQLLTGGSASMGSNPFSGVSG